jgi:hypothetical protein
VVGPVLAMDAAPVARDFSGHWAPAIARIAYDVALLAIEDSRGRPMTNDNGGAPSVTNTFAGMLGEVEDLATKLTLRVDELTRELQSAQSELERVERVRTAMIGGPVRKKATPRDGRSRAKQEAAAERASKVLAWAKDRGEWGGHEAAEFLDMPNQGVGPVLAGMVRREELTVREDDDGKRLYAVAE